MKFGKQLRDRVQKEWRFYAVDYKELKQALKTDDPEESFFTILRASEDKLKSFYEDKENWALSYMTVLEERVETLRSIMSEVATDSDTSSSNTSVCTENVEPTNQEEVTIDLSELSKRDSFDNWAKEEYRRMGASKEFKAFIYAKKSLVTFSRELALLMDFVELNKTAFSKILKKFDKRTGSSLRDSTLNEIESRLPFLDNTELAELKRTVDSYIVDVNALRPQLPDGWERRKVYTIGCFDLFHRGHQNVLMSLREFGYYIVAGIHDDESYFKLKNKYTIDNIETRMKNVKPYVDQIYVIPSTDPLPYIRAMVSEQDIRDG